MGWESILNRSLLTVQVDTKQRQKGITMYFTFLYNTFQNLDLMQSWKANWWLWDKAGTFVYRGFGLTFRRVSVLAPIFRKYPLSCWWICRVSDPSPKLCSVPVWMDELNLRLRSFHQVNTVLCNSTFSLSRCTWLCVLEQLNTSDSLCYVTNCVMALLLFQYLILGVFSLYGNRWAMQEKFSTP